MIRTSQRWLPAVAALQLAACTMLPPPSSAPARQPAPSQPASADRAADADADADSVSSRAAGAVDSQPAPRPAAAASRTLLEQSRTEQAAGEYSRAAASLERALRIDPDDPWLWLELGQVRLAEGDGTQAEMLARRALTLADGDAALESSASRLLEAVQLP